MHRDHMANGFAGAVFFFIFLYFLARYMKRVRQVQMQVPVLPTRVVHNHTHAAHMAPPAPVAQLPQPPPYCLPEGLSAPPSYEEAIKIAATADSQKRF